MNSGTINPATFAQRYDQALKAKYLLLNPEYSVDEISAELGFHSLEEFREVFETVTGQYPDVYRSCVESTLGYCGRT